MSWSDTLLSSSPNPQSCRAFCSRRPTHIAFLGGGVQIPDGETAIRSVAVNADGNMAVAANNKGMCFVWLWSSELKELSEGSDLEGDEEGSRGKVG